jgi:hypothetical protein
MGTPTGGSRGTEERCCQNVRKVAERLVAAKNEVTTFNK